MRRYIACLIGLLAISTVPCAYGEEPVRETGKVQQQVQSPPAQTPSQAKPGEISTNPQKQEESQVQGQAQRLPARTPSAVEPTTNAAKPPTQGESGNGVGIVAGLLAVVTVLLIGVIIWQWTKAPQAKDDDKALEGLRIIYGFWLIVVALLIALLVLFVTLSAIRIGPDAKTTDIVAIIGTVTGLITTLVAAFFGIQQAGAGRSQAMTALAQLRGPGPDGAGVSKLEPAHGPHSGGTKVSITGNGFTGASAVNFGATQGTNFKVENDGLVTVNSPSAPPKVDEAKVSIVFPSTSTPNREVGTFYFYTIDPPHGPAAGLTPVRVLGSGLREVSAVKFGAMDATNLTPLSTDPSGREFREVTAPAGAARSDVTVELVYPVDSKHKTSVIGTYHYD